MSVVRFCVAWVFFGIGHAIYIAFDRCLPWGMSWPVYRTYNGCMTLSGDLQGAGVGPWTYPTTTEKVT